MAEVAGIGALEVNAAREQPTVDASRPDSVLLIEARTDVEAFGTFYDRHVDQMFHWFLLRTFAADVAADLTAETFAKALGSLSRFDPDRGEGGAWLFGIGRNEFRHWTRKHRVANRGRQRLGIMLDLPVDEFDAVETRVDLERSIGPITDAVDRLPDGLRRAVVLRVMEGLPYDEVAAQLDCTEGAARVRVSRALARLCEEIDS